MRIPNAVHEAGPWRIHEIVHDFILEDAWALPARGGAGDFDAVLGLMTTLDPSNSGSFATRSLWVARDLLGRWFSLGRIAVSEGDPADAGPDLPIPGTSETSLVNRLPEDLRGTGADVRLGSTPFRPLYRTDNEFAAEIANRTVHGVIHLAWVHEGDDRYRGQMGIYVKPRGRFGAAYLAFIKPFRYLIVYPALMRKIEHEWAAASS